MMIEECIPCDGTGKLLATDGINPPSRSMPCTVCGGSGKDPRFIASWQPIETAPKNQSILVHWRLAPPYDEGLITVSLFTDDNHSPGEDKATHWMPLPEPPK